MTQYVVESIMTEDSLLVLPLILIPLISCIILISCGYKIGKTYSLIFSASMAVLTAGFNALFCYTTMNFGIKELGGKTINWVQINELELSFSIYQDGLSYLMIYIVSIISSCIILYSAWYMNNDPAIIKFQGLLFFFSFSMLFMVSSGNFFQFYIGWECIGLASFLLISHWTNRNEAVNGGLKAVVYNRIGDAFFILALLLFQTTYKSLDFHEIKALSQASLDSFATVNNLGTILLILAAFVKSAMFIFHGWLFNAMEGPTPVSALLHSATMVTAGIFLLLRVSFLLENNLNCSIIILIAGTITTLFAALGAYFQTDMKRIVAYSTCSQLGLMVVGIGFSCFSQTMYHLTTHAFFKAMLFFMAGILIHSILNHQDIRTGSKAFLYLPSTEALNGSLIASLALFGFPTFSGFFSKDFLIESIFEVGNVFSLSAFISVCFASGFTAAYSMKSIFKSYFYNDTFLGFNGAIYAFYSSKLLTVFTTLLVFSTTLGFFLYSFFEKGDFYSLYHGLTFGSDNILNNIASVELFLLPTYVSIFGATFSFFLNRELNTTPLPYNFYFKKYFSLYKRDYSLNEVLNRVLATPVLTFAYNISYKLIDRGFLELFGPTGLYTSINNLYSKSNLLHNGSIYHYIRLIFKTLFVIFIILILFFFDFINLSSGIHELNINISEDYFDELFNIKRPRLKVSTGFKTVFSNFGIRDYSTNGAWDYSTFKHKDLNINGISRTAYNHGKIVHDLYYQIKENQNPLPIIEHYYDILASNGMSNSDYIYLSASASTITSDVKIINSKPVLDMEKMKKDFPIPIHIEEQVNRNSSDLRNRNSSNLQNIYSSDLQIIFDSLNDPKLCEIYLNHYCNGMLDQIKENWYSSDSANDWNWNFSTSIKQNSSSFTLGYEIAEYLDVGVGKSNDIFKRYPMLSVNPLITECYGRKRLIIYLNDLILFFYEAPNSTKATLYKNIFIRGMDSNGPEFRCMLPFEFYWFNNMRKTDSAILNAGVISGFYEYFVVRPDKQLRLQQLLDDSEKIENTRNSGIDTKNNQDYI